MSTETPVLQRAFQIARHGRCANTKDVRKALAREGYSGIDLMHISPTISRQIKQLCDEARVKAAG